MRRQAHLARACSEINRSINHLSRLYSTPLLFNGSTRHIRLWRRRRRRCAVLQYATARLPSLYDARSKTRVAYHKDYTSRMTTVKSQQRIPCIANCLLAQNLKPTNFTKVSTQSIEIAYTWDIAKRTTQKLRWRHPYFLFIYSMYWIYVYL